MSLNKPLKALLLGSVAVSLAGAGTTQAMPDRDSPSAPDSGEAVPGSRWDNSGQDSREQLPSDTSAPDSGEAVPGSRWDNSGQDSRE